MAKDTLIVLLAMACFSTQAILGKFMMRNIPPRDIYLVEALGVTITGPLTILLVTVFLREKLQNYPFIGGALIICGLLYLHLHANDIARFLRKHEFSYNLHIRRYRK